MRVHTILCQKERSVLHFKKNVSDFFDISIDMTLPKWAIFIMGSMGKLHVFCRIQLNFVSDYIKNVDAYTLHTISY